MTLEETRVALAVSEENASELSRLLEEEKERAIVILSHK